MRFMLWVCGFLLAVGAGGGEIIPYQARISSAANRDTLDTVHARNAAAAEDALEGRHAELKVLSLVRLDRSVGYDWFLARMSVRGVNAIDTVLAKGSGDARRIATSRFPEGRIVSLIKLRNADGYAFFETTVHGASKKAFKDFAFADGTANARKAFSVRYPDGKISSVTDVR
ncbi:MAG: hypothetical protein HOJ57_14050 [Lentisphaerae bacterium]|jgi:hypothetical protein|nr:hypothetical protein [Lentisphaerota bacterium]MBT5607058.1 hypothetical protein [Lentisphaerota bacterium]MBT7055812.1 hypothetical protein [Lentisphaerota bacterium]